MEKYGAFLSWLTLAMIVFIFVTVVSRNVFNTVWIPVQELAVYCHATALMLGMVYAWHHDRHVRVDVFYQYFSAHKKRKLNLMGTVLLLLPMMGFVIWSCWFYVIESWSRLEGSGETGGLPLMFLFKSLMLLMPVSILGYVLMSWVKSSKSKNTEDTN
jgi:TRAP-type mannitol/chloroaromatic compound transport system permease small subunit